MQLFSYFCKMFSNSAKYAIRTVFYLSRHKEDNSRFKVEEIARELNIPKAYLSKILQQLSRSKIVSSTKGRGGGFFLTTENSKKTLMDIIICIEGYNIFDDCILGLPDCGDKNPCHLHQHYKKFKDNLSKTIKDSSIENLREEDLIYQYKL